MTISKIRTITFNNEEVYIRTHLKAVDGLDLATFERAGLMTAEDKAKLDHLSELTEASETQNGLMSKEDKKHLDLLVNNPITAATSTDNGLMTAEDKQKLDSLNINHDLEVNNMILLNNLNLWPDANQKINLPKPLSECKTGIVLVWRLDKKDDLYHYQHIPKYHIRHASSKNKEMIATETGNCYKSIIITDTSLVGVMDNSSRTTGSYLIRLHEILEY